MIGGHGGGRLGSAQAKAARSSAEYALLEVAAGEVELALRRVAADLEVLAAATAAMPYSSWAADLERRIARWNARA